MQDQEWPRKSVIYVVAGADLLAAVSVRLLVILILSQNREPKY